MISGWMARRTADRRRTRSIHPKGLIMEPQLIEWGPAHLRDEAPTFDVEPTDRPDDN